MFRYVLLAGVAICAWSAPCVDARAEDAAQPAEAARPARSAATVVVASAESRNKASADFVCDGTDDEAEIQAAIDRLPATGGKVLLLEGTYRISEKGHVLLDKPKTTIQGMGKSTRLEKPETGDSWIFRTAGGKLWYAPEAQTGVTFRDLALHSKGRASHGGISLATGTSYVLIEGCRFENLGKGIEASNATYALIITNNEFEGNRKSISLAGVHDCIIVENKESASEHSGLLPGPVSFVCFEPNGDTTFECLIANNSIEHVYSDGHDGAAGKFWVDHVDGKCFRINVDRAPGAKGAAFNWHAQR